MSGKQCMKCASADLCDAYDPLNLSDCGAYEAQLVTKEKRPEEADGKNFTFLAAPPDGRILCERCEAAAVANGRNGRTQGMVLDSPGIAGAGSVETSKPHIPRDFCRDG